MSHVDAAEYAEIIAEARARRTLANAGLLDSVRSAEAQAGATFAATGLLNPADYRITINTNPVITPAVITPVLFPAPGEPAAAGPPPSTLDAIRAPLIRYEAGRPRTVQTTLGPSELGTPCDRQIALKLAGVARRGRGLPWAPMCGTAVHTLMEAALTAENERLGYDRWVLEQRVQLDAELTGHGDAYDRDTRTVIDWKYTGTTARKKASRRTVPNDELISPEYRTQAHLYGLGHINAGRPVDWVRIVMLARSHDFDQSVEWTEEYREDIAIAAITRFYAIRDQVANMDAAIHPERLSAVPPAPGDACKWCPFQRPTPAGGADVDATGCVGQQTKSDEWLATLPTT